ncbi:hypothetical protein GCM10029992_58060 [Glycomyces albus]
MRREIRYGLSGLRPKPLAALAAWSVPQALPASISGLVLARAVDDGFLAGRPWTGVAWLAGLLLAAGIGAIGTRMVYATVGGLVEPFRDRLADRVVAGSLRAAVAGAGRSGAVALLTRQLEVVRDSYAGLIVAVRGFAITSVGVTGGLLALAPSVAAVVLPPFALGLALFTATLGVAAARHRRAIHADEHLADRAGAVLAGAADLSACGAEAHGRSLTAAPIRDQARAERSLAWVAALRSMCFVVGGWTPLIAVLAAALGSPTAA